MKTLQPGRTSGKDYVSACSTEAQRLVSAGSTEAQPAGSEAPVRVDSMIRGLELLDVAYPACENNDVATMVMTSAAGEDDVGEW